MGSIGLWLVLISQFEYPIRTLAAGAGAGAADAGVLLLLEGTGGALFRSGVTQEREPYRKGMCSQNIKQGARARKNAHPLHNSLFVSSECHQVRAHAHKPTHTHATTARLYHQGVIRVPLHTPHHQQAIPANPQAVAVKQCYTHTGAHACNINRAVTWRAPHWVLLLCWLPLLGCLALARLAWSAKSCWVGDTGLSHLASGLELELGAWEAIFRTIPFEPPKLINFQFEWGSYALAIIDKNFQILAPELMNI
eukprot:1161368-Pelagomonas_calceolata.AAC.6